MQDYSIINNKGQLAAQYANDEFKILNASLLNDIQNCGLRVPYHLQSQTNNQALLSYPPQKGDASRLFAIVFKESTFENELIKHDFTLREG